MEMGFVHGIGDWHKSKKASFASEVFAYKLCKQMQLSGEKEITLVYFHLIHIFLEWNKYGYAVYAFFRPYLLTSRTWCGSESPGNRE